MCGHEWIHTVYTQNYTCYTYVSMEMICLYPRPLIVHVLYVGANCLLCPPLCMYMYIHNIMSYMYMC